MARLSAFADEAGSDLNDQINALAEAGVRWIDLRSVGGSSIEKLPVASAEWAATELERAGIGVNMFGSPIGKIDVADSFSIDRERLDHLLHMAEAFSCRSVRFFSYRNQAHQLPPARFEADVFRRVEKLLAVAESEDLLLFHENEGGLYGEGTEQLLRLAETFGPHPSFRMIFDFANLTSQGEAAWPAWERLRDHTHAFHLKERDGDRHHVPVGHGCGEVVRILTDARARGFDGSLTLEPHLRFSSLAWGPDNRPLDQWSAADAFQLAAEAGRDVCEQSGLAV
ncbi:MAG: sugar phosphate isomerase/epimerase family protein [Opitutales bacterium]